MRMRATCAVYWDDDYSDGLELEVDATFTTLAFLAGRSPEPKAGAELRPFLADTGFRYGRNQYGAATLTLQPGDV